MTSAFTFNKDGKYDGYVSKSLYSIIPTLLELPDIKCGEFRQKFNKLIDDLITDINNINNPSEKMLYHDDIHIKNAREVIRAVFACFDCILKKIKDETLTENCIQLPETDEENPLVDINKNLSILQQTFNIISPEIETNPVNYDSHNSSDISESQTNSTIDSSRSSSTISSITNPTYSTRSTSRS